MIGVLGIDPSYTRTGIATPTDTRSLTPPASTADLPPLARAARRRAALRSATLPAMRQADVIAIEGMYPSLQYGVIDRAELLGTLTDQALQATPAAVLHVAPASVKIYATGNGQSTKHAMLSAVDQHSDLTSLVHMPMNDDEADAWWICALVSDLLGQPLVQLPPTHRRALDAYRPPWTRKHPDPWVRHHDPAAHAARVLGG